MQRKSRGTPVWSLALVAIALSLAIGRGAAGEGAPLPALIDALEASAYAPEFEAPALSGPLLDGGQVSLAQLKGRVVLVNFWATWCVPCLTELPSLRRLHDEFSAAGLTVLAVNIAEERQHVRRYLDRLAVRLPVLLDEDGSRTKTYGVVVTPSAFILARDGRPVALAVGSRDWDQPAARALIRALLAEREVRGTER